jgi:hypothetical protein
MLTFAQNDTMNKRRRFMRLLAIGLFVMSGANVLHFFVPMNDFIYGGLVGIGIGMMLLSFIKMKATPSS